MSRFNKEGEFIQRCLYPVLFIDTLEIFFSNRKDDIVLAGYTASATMGGCTFDGYPLQFYLRNAF